MRPPSRIPPIPPRNGSMRVVELVEVLAEIADVVEVAAYGGKNVVVAMVGVVVLVAVVTQEFQKCIISYILLLYTSRARTRIISYQRFSSLSSWRW